MVNVTFSQRPPPQTRSVQRKYTKDEEGNLIAVPFAVIIDGAA